MRAGTVHFGHQRRFGEGYFDAKRWLDAGELDWMHSLRAVSGDPFPPPAFFCATSGGLFRDVSVHDVDIIRWLIGQDVVEVFARGSNNGDPLIGDVGDVDTAVALLTLADGTLATVTATRYNGAGHDVRLDVMGAGVPLSSVYERSALTSAETGVEFPTGTAHLTFAERFQKAYRAGLRCFIELVLGERGNPCTAKEAVAAAIVTDAAQLSLKTGHLISVPSLQALVDGDEEPLEPVELGIMREVDVCQASSSTARVERAVRANASSSGSLRYQGAGISMPQGPS